MSNRAYTGGPGDPLYEAVVNGGVKLSDEIPIAQGADASLNMGDLSLNNFDGRLDAWRKDLWVNRTLTVLLGDTTWPRSDFRVIQTLAIAKLMPKGRDAFALKIVNKQQRLNTPITDLTLGGTGENAASMIPLAFGELHNIEPLCIDSVAMVYQVHQGAVEWIKEVRVNGVPVDFTADHTNGRFTLLVPPSGIVTCSVQGAKVGGVYLRTIAQIIKHIATVYGKDSDRFTLADIDTANFDQYDATHQQTVGLYVKDRMNVLDACNQLARSLNSVVTVSRLGKLRLYQFKLATAPTVTIDKTVYYEQTLGLLADSEVVAAVKLSYAKNWTVQSKADLGGLPEAHKEMYGQEFYEAKAFDNAIRDKYRLYTNTDPRQTLLMGQAEAEAECLRLFNLFKDPRGTFVLEATRDLVLLDPGTEVMLYGDRFDLSAGVAGVVTKVTPDFQTYRNLIEVTI
jgi:hypothetical protein